MTYCKMGVHVKTRLVPFKVPRNICTINIFWISVLCQFFVHNFEHTKSSRVIYHVKIGIM